MAKNIVPLELRMFSRLGNMEDDPIEFCRSCPPEEVASLARWVNRKLWKRPSEKHGVSNQLRTTHKARK